MEKGTITLIGATTENPSFEVNSALLSRSQVYVLKPLGEKELLQLIDHALKKDDELKKRKIVVKEHAALLNISGGDARKILNLLELISESIPGEIEITDQLVMALERYAPQSSNPGNFGPALTFRPRNVARWSTF